LPPSELTFSADSNGGLGPALRPGDRIHLMPSGRPNGVYVLGCVAKPGSIEYRKGITAAQALAESGGGSGNADLGRIEVERGGEVVATLSAEQARSFSLQPGDVVRVPIVEKPAYVFVMGAVGEEGRYDFRVGMKLTEAIALAGGLRPFADSAKVTIARRIQGALRRTTYDLAKIVQGLVPDVELQPSDIVEVGAR
jgi:protein involved in polysaccharide export with SLBB domain